MATPLTQKLQEELDAISGSYETNFAGQNRQSRDLNELEGLISKTKSLLARIDNIPGAARGGDLDAIEKAAREQLAMLEGERVAIQNAKKAGPMLEKFTPLATGANFVFAKYQRHFAGQGRNTRDLELLDEMIDDLRKIEKEMEAIVAKSPHEQFRNDLDVVRRNIDMYRTERGEVVKSQATGSNEDLAGVYATLANNQFELYRSHFAGLSRTTRRPQLLARMIASLERIQKGMKALETKKHSADFNKGNVGIVEENLQTWRRELTEIRKARESTQLVDIMGQLGTAANDVFAEYREKFAGKSRTQVERKVIVVMCDRLDEILRQMRDLGRMEPNEVNAKNIDIVTENLTMYNREFDLIGQAQTQAGATP